MAEYKVDLVRNVCILAHVDHGKTTLADRLLAHGVGGLVSVRQAGRLRYLDHLEEEQRRGITMKASCATLSHGRYTINLLDTPGHVDFSAEVETTLSLADSAFVLVDAVEGVCPQTCAVLEAAWRQGLQPLLVINKVDRLMVELQLNEDDAYVHLRQLLEAVNAIMAELNTEATLARSDLEAEKKEHFDQQTTPNCAKECDEKEHDDDWKVYVEEKELYFSPEAGNVLFASAWDGWAFRIGDFAKLYSNKLKCREVVLRNTLWGDYYYSSKERRVLSGAAANRRKPLFVQMILENVWAVYRSGLIDVGSCEERASTLQRMAASLAVKVPLRDLRQSEARSAVAALLANWLPLAPCLLDALVEETPSPRQLSVKRVNRLFFNCAHAAAADDTHLEDALSEKLEQMRGAILACSADEGVPVVALISKVFTVETRCLHDIQETRTATKAEGSLSASQLEIRRAAARRAHEQLRDAATTSSDDLQAAAAAAVAIEEEKQFEKVQHELEFVSLARIMSGSLTAQQSVFVLGARYNPLRHLPSALLNENPSTNSEGLVDAMKEVKHADLVKVKALYTLRGRELFRCKEARAGEIVGITGVAGEVLVKSGTLCSSLCCPGFAGVAILAEREAIIRVSVEPARACDMASLLRGLRLLERADPGVLTREETSGELLVAAAGEVHLAKCLADLEHRYANVALNVSELIVPFRETVIELVQDDDAIDDEEEIDMEEESTCPVSAEVGSSTTVKADYEIVEPGVVECTFRVSSAANDRFVRLRLRAAPIPQSVVHLLDNQVVLLRQLRLASSATSHQSDTAKLLYQRLRSLVEESSVAATPSALCVSDIDLVWAFGPDRCGPNLLVNRAQRHASVWPTESVQQRLSTDQGLINGFALASAQGPLCGEPLRGVAIFVEQLKEFEFSSSAEDRQETSVTLSVSAGQLLNLMSRTMSKTILSCAAPRLVLAEVTCELTARADALGRMYAELSRRQARVLSATQRPGSQVFAVVAVLPAIESLGLAEALRKRTSGLVSPQLRFSGWQVFPHDALRLPSDAAPDKEARLRALAYVRTVRRRKGLPVREQLVSRADQQRTLSRKK